MIALVILGIIFSFGGIYFVSLWREHRISVQHDFLQREARYAMDFIINGQMKEERNEKFRYAGIIASHHIDTNGNRLFGDPNGGTFIGQIYVDPNDPPSLCIVYHDGSKHRIIPTASETGLEDNPYELDNPYEIGIEFKDSNIDPSLYQIRLELIQNVYSRELKIEMLSKVRLRN